MEVKKDITIVKIKEEETLLIPVKQKTGSGGLRASGHQLSGHPQLSG
jgi:hypothetical protein